MNLKWNFANEFVQTLYEIHTYVDYRSRDELVKRAVEKREDFF